jgi:hypothetical protein
VAYEIGAALCNTCTGGNEARVVVVEVALRVVVTGAVVRISLSLQHQRKLNNWNSINTNG